MTEKQKRAIRFIENELEIKYKGHSDAEASAFIGKNLKYAKKCAFFESQMPIPVARMSFGDVNDSGDYSLKRGLSRELLIRDIQHGKSGEECMTNFSHNLLRENMEEDSIEEIER